MLTLQEFQTKYASDLLIAHRVQGGFPIFGHLKFKAVLRVAEGRLRWNGGWVVQEGSLPT
jgi:hypothetical protein